MVMIERNLDDCWMGIFKVPECIMAFALLEGIVTVNIKVYILGQSCNL